MKKALFTLFILLKFNFGYSQVDNNGNPVFNSVIINESKVDSLDLSANYYTLKNNIENKGSSVFIAEEPNLTQIEDAAKKLLSNFFILSKRGSTLCIILLDSQPAKRFIVLNPKTGKGKNYACKIKGDISETRAKELLSDDYDPKARLKAGKLFFNKDELQVFSEKEMTENVIELIKENKLYETEDTGIKLLSQTELKQFILQESKEGKQYDFFTPIKGHELDGIQIKPGVFSSLISIALYKWGRANYELGVNKVEDAYVIFSEFKGEALTQREKDYIKMGFNKELEK